MSRTSPQPHPIASRLLALGTDITRYVAKACRRRAHSNDAPRDLAQETVVRGIESIDNFNRPEEALRPWMLGIANHVVRDDERASYRYDARFSRTPVDLETVENGGPTPDREADAKRALARVWAALEAMPEHQRTVIVLVGIDGRSHAYAAEQLGLSEVATRKLLERARDHLERTSGVRREDLRLALPLLFRREERRYGLSAFGLDGRHIAVLGASALLLACFVFVRREERASPPPVLELAVSDFSIHGISMEPLPVPEKQAQEPTAAVVEPVQTVQKPKVQRPQPSLPKHEESLTKALDIALAGVDRSPVQLQ